VSYQQFVQLIGHNRSAAAQGRGGIGCYILGEPVFLPRDLWIPLKDEMPGNVVQGKFFDTENEDEDGRRIWDAVQLAVAALPITTRQLAERKVRWGRPTLERTRLCQAQFRAGITNAFARTCAITGESTLLLLEAAHIRPVSEEGSHNLANGLLLRSDFQKLFDAGLVTVTPDYTTVVSDQIKVRWFNGKAYNTLHGQPLRSLPGRVFDRPDPEQLRWHNDHCFERAPLLG
jgi:putative restriction endonuclease